MNSLNIKDLTPEQIEDLQKQLNSYNKYEDVLKQIRNYVTRNDGDIHLISDSLEIKIGSYNNIIINPISKAPKNFRSNGIHTLTKVKLKYLKIGDMYLNYNTISNNTIITLSDIEIIYNNNRYNNVDVLFIDRHNTINTFARSSENEVYLIK